MAYWDGWLLANDPDFIARVSFCAETEGLGVLWANDNRFSVAASPGFSDAYASALASGVPNPGRDPAVISDAEILSAVQALGS